MSAKPRPSDSPRRVRPNCTHITMDMTYQVARCDNCGRFPALGWLYQCNQDQYQEASIKTESQRLNANPADSILITELKALGFSPSTIKQAVTGNYTEGQLNLLKAQKANLRMVIEKQTGYPAESAERKASNGSEFFHPNITTRKHRHSNPKRRPLFSAPAPVAKCTLKCCHTCRPYYRDRVYGHLNSILDDVDLAWSQRDLTKAPVLDVALIRQIGLRTPARPLRVLKISEGHHESSTSSADSHASVLVNAPEILTRDDFDSLSEYEEYIYERSKSNHRYTNLLRLQAQRLHPSLDLDRPSNEDTSLTQGLPRRKSLSEGNEQTATRLKFKWRLARILGRSTSSPAWLSSRNTSKDRVKAVTLPSTPSKHPTRKQSDGSTASEPLSSPRGSETDVDIELDDSRDLDFPEDSSEGSEVEVEGGVALTEEAIEERYPDIITQA